MSVKILLIISAIFFFQFMYAQAPTAAEIKEKGIKKIIIVNQDGGSESSFETYYDSYGYDTAKYVGGDRNTYSIIDYNEKQQPSKITHYFGSGKQSDVTIYTYNPDMSFTIENTDADFGLVTKAFYNKKGKIVSYIIPDGTEKKYVYNTKGRLIKAFTIPKNGGVKMTETYTYNSAGKIILMKTTGDYPSTTTYLYQKNGLLKQSFIKGSDDIFDKNIYTYVY